MEKSAKNQFFSETVWCVIFRAVSLHDRFGIKENFLHKSCNPQWPLKFSCSQKIEHSSIIWSKSLLKVTESTYQKLSMVHMSYASFTRTKNWTNKLKIELTSICTEQASLQSRMYAQDWTKNYDSIAKLTSIFKIEPKIELTSILTE